jgi:hypothetical protein
MTSFPSETGGPAPDRLVGAVGVNVGHAAAKAPLPLVHLLTSFSSLNVQMASITTTCGAEIGVLDLVTERKKEVRRQIMEKADVWKHATAWYSLTTCPDCLAVVER